MADYQQFPNNLTTLARRLRPLLFEVVTSVSNIGGVDLSKILLISSGSVTEYDATSAGLGTSGGSGALGDAVSGDIVLCPAATISGNHTVPNGVELMGRGFYNTIFSGTITLGSTAILSHCQVYNAIVGSGYVINVKTSADHYVIFGYDISGLGSGQDTLTFGYNITLGNVSVGLFVGPNHEVDQADSIFAFGSGTADKSNSGSNNAGSILLNDTNINSAGDTQVRTHAGQDTITSITSAWLTVDEMDIPTDTVWHGEIKIALTEDGCANSWAYKIDFVAENDGGTTTILYSNVSVLYEDIATWDCQIIADDANDRVAVQLTDSASTAISGDVLYTSMWTIAEITNPA